MGQERCLDGIVRFLRQYSALHAGGFYCRQDKQFCPYGIGFQYTQDVIPEGQLDFGINRVVKVVVPVYVVQHAGLDRGAGFNGRLEKVGVEGKQPALAAA